MRDFSSIVSQHTNEISMYEYILLVLFCAYVMYPRLLPSFLYLTMLIISQFTNF